MTLSSQWDGKCKGTINENGEIVIHTWKAGEPIYYQKEPKCICKNEQCYDRQKTAVGNPAEQKQQQGTGNLYSVQVRTESEKTEDSIHMADILWTLSAKKALEVFPLHVSEGESELFWHNKDRVILAEVFFKQLSYNWSKP